MALPSTPNELLELLKTVNKDKDAVAPDQYRYIIYVRKSTDEENKQVRSLKDQKDECVEFAQRTKLKWVGFIEEAESAKEPDIRPKFKQMLNDLKAGKYDGIIAWHPDRLARNMREAGDIIDLVDKKIIQDLKFVSFSFSNDPSGKLLLGITFAISKEYSDKLSDNVSRGNKRSVQEGRYINKAIHGYFKDRNQNLRPDVANFPLVKNAFNMRLLGGKTLDEIADYLNASGYTRINNVGDKPKIFNMTKQKVQKMLLNPVFTGILKYGKNEIVNLIELYDFVPMITVPEFMQINELSSDAQFIKLAKAYRRLEGVTANLLNGVVFCGECGGHMYAGATPKRNKAGAITARYFYYRCDNEGCPRKGKSMRANVLIKYIFDFLDTKPFSSKESYEHYVRETKVVAEKRVVEAKRNLASLKGAAGQLVEKLRRTKDMLLGDDPEDVKVYYRGDLKQIEDKIKGNAVSIASTEEFISNNKANLHTYAEFLELMDKMAQTLASIGNMTELDYFIRKMFLNFTINGKNVEKHTLNTPFDELYNLKVSKGGRGGT